MIHGQTTRVLERLLEATRVGALVWREDEGMSGTWYRADYDGSMLVIQFLYLEATNQAGADRHILRLMMPGRSAFFACGSEGYHLLLEVLAAAFDSWGDATKDTGDFALNFLDKVIASADKDE